MDNDIPEELSLAFQSKKAIDHLADLVLGIKPPTTEADRKFLEDLRGLERRNIASIEKSDADPNL